MMTRGTKFAAAVQPKPFVVGLGVLLLIDGLELFLLLGRQRHPERFQKVAALSRIMRGQVEKGVH